MVSHIHPVTLLTDTILSSSTFNQLSRIESDLPNRDPEQETSARGTSASRPTAANAEPRDSLGTFELPQRGGGEQRRSKEREGWMGGGEQDGHDQFGHGEWIRNSWVEILVSGWFERNSFVRFLEIFLESDSYLDSIFFSDKFYWYSIRFYYYCCYGDIVIGNNFQDFREGSV